MRRHAHANPIVWGADIDLIRANVRFWPKADSLAPSSNQFAAAIKATLPRNQLIVLNLTISRWIRTP